MTPLPEATIAPAIAEQLTIISDAKARLSATVLAAQATCEHRIVSETKYESGGFAARRICNHCRLEEEGCPWSGGSTWSRHDYGPSDLGNVDGRFVIPVERDAFYLMRVR